MRALLKEQANYFLRSDLYEVFKYSIQNEAFDIALKQSTDFEQVKFAKALHHWIYFLDNVLLKLTV